MRVFARSLQASLLCCVAVVCLVGTAAGALDKLVAQSTVVHVVVHAPPGFLRDKPEVFVRTGSRVRVASNMRSNGLQVDRYGNVGWLMTSLLSTIDSFILRSICYQAKHDCDL